MATARRFPSLEERLQRLGEVRLNACYEEMERLEAGEAWPGPPAACAPFDGCVTCTVREVLDAVWDEFMAEARREAERGHRSD